MMAAYLDPDEYDLSGELVPCEFCEQLFPLCELIEHTTGCRPDLTSEHKEYQGNVEDEDAFEPLVEKAKESIKTSLLSETVPARKIYSLETKQTGVGIDITKLKDELKVSAKASGTHQIYNLESIKRTDAKMPKSTSHVKIIKKENLKPTLNNSEKIGVNNNKLSTDSGLNHSIKNTFDDPITAEEGALSSDDDTVESIESFWRRAAVILKKRLTENYNDKISTNSYKSDNEEKSSSSRNKFVVNPTTRKLNLK